MSNLLSQSLHGIKAFAEYAAKKVEAVDQASIESKTKGQLDLEKAKELIDNLAKKIELQNAAIDQLQQRTSNLEGYFNRLEAQISSSKFKIK